MLKQRSKCKNPGLIPELRKKAFSLSPLNVDVNCGLSLYGLYFVKELSSVLGLLTVFIMKDCWIPSHVFLYQLKT